MEDVAVGGPGAGPAREARHADAALVDAALAHAHAAVVAHLLRAVVGQENDDGILGQLELIELGEQAADVVVDVRDHAVDLGDDILLSLAGQRVTDLGELIVGQVHVLVHCVILIRHLQRRSQRPLREAWYTPHLKRLELVCLAPV